SLTAIAIAIAVAIGACASQKSSNPLAPTVAGPIPGVNISSPQLVDPSAGSKIAVDKQPITLMVNNASTSGVRPLTYLFEVASDSAFNTRVFYRDGITPGGDGHTSLKLPAPLPTGPTSSCPPPPHAAPHPRPYS